jgi:hypothetical protein
MTLSSTIIFIKNQNSLKTISSFQLNNVNFNK